MVTSLRVTDGLLRFLFANPPGSRYSNRSSGLWLHLGKVALFRKS